MEEHITATDLDALKASNEFLNLLLDNTGAAVLLMDEASGIHRFNNSFLELFGGAECSGSFGRAMGCVHTLRENMACGETSHCGECTIHRLVRETMASGQPMEERGFTQYFHVEGRPLKKVLNVSTRRLTWHRRNLVMVLFHDVTEAEMARVRLDRDLEAAATIQRSLLPDGVPEIAGLDIAWRFEPCAKVGGDIFDLCRPDSRHVVLYMLDVCGHGVSAAFFSVAISQYLRSRITLRSGTAGVCPPEGALLALNEAFPFERFDSYFTITYAVIDLVEGILHYSSAGHPPPILLRRSGLEELSGGHGPAIGIAPDARYEGRAIPLEEGDKLLLYTDGILENRNAAGEHLGKEGLFGLLERCRHGPVRELVESACEEAKAFGKGKENDDDISVLGAEYTG